MIPAVGFAFDQSWDRQTTPKSNERTQGSATGQSQYQEIKILRVPRRSISCQTPAASNSFFVGASFLEEK